MFKKKAIFLLALTFSVTSCANAWDSMKRGLTGQKVRSTDEFLVKKKYPLILPPEFDSLPSPDDREEALEEMTSFEKTLSITTAEVSDEGSSSNTTEESILNKIRKR